MPDKEGLILQGCGGDLTEWVDGINEMLTKAGMGCKAIVVKGGHHIGNAVDVLFNGENFYHFETSRIDTKNTHGTGCTFSSAIASQLAKGKSVPLAVESAKAYVTMAIEHSLAIGKGCGPTHHFYELYQHGLSKE